jgi:peptidyl-tRNA hydrolase
MAHKMYCVFAKESIAKMEKFRGKMCAQAGHAFLHTYVASLDTFPDVALAYYSGDHAFKIVLIVDTVNDLVALEQAYQGKCQTCMITDKGFTVFDEPTTTCLGLGPINVDDIGDDIKALKLFK